MAENKINISVRTIKSINPPPAGQQAVYWDATLPGFGIRVSPGGTVAFIAQGRLNGRAKRVTVGKFGLDAPDKARRDARNALSDMSKGIDPDAKKKARRSKGLTVEAALEEYLAENSKMKESTRQDYRVRLRRYMSDWLDRRVVDIGRDDVKEKHREIGERSEAQANLVMRYLRAVINHVADNHFDADGNPIILHNPVRALKRQWFVVRPKTDYLQEHQLRPWLEAVQALDNDIARDYLTFLLLTGLRRSEALGLAWENVNLKAETIIIPDPKNRRAHILPITTAMKEILERRLDLRVGDHVFQSPAGVFGGANGAIKQVRKKCGFYFSAHGLRRSFATIANDNGLGAYTIKALMNHHDANDITAAYIQRTATKLREPMQGITDYIMGAQ